MRREKVRQLRRVACHRLCDYAGVLPGAVPALRVHGVRAAVRTAGGGATARRSPASRRRESAGGYSGRARHDADRSEIGEVGSPSLLVAGRRPGHPRLSSLSAAKTWMPGTRPGMTIFAINPHSILTYPSGLRAAAGGTSPT